MRPTPPEQLPAFRRSRWLFGSLCPASGSVRHLVPACTPTLQEAAPGIIQDFPLPVPLETSSASMIGFVQSRMAASSVIAFGAVFRLVWTARSIIAVVLDEGGHKDLSASSNPEQKAAAGAERFCSGTRCVSEYPPKSHHSVSSSSRSLAAFSWVSLKADLMSGIASASVQPPPLLRPPPTRQTLRGPSKMRCFFGDDYAMRLSWSFAPRLPRFRASRADVCPFRPTEAPMQIATTKRQEQHSRAKAVRRIALRQQLANRNCRYAPQFHRVFGKIVRKRGIVLFHGADHRAYDRESTHGRCVEAGDDALQHRQHQVAILSQQLQQ